MRHARYRVVEQGKTVRLANPSGRHRSMSDLATGHLTVAIFGIGTLPPLDAAAVRSRSVSCSAHITASLPS